MPEATPIELITSQIEDIEEGLETGGSKKWLIDAIKELKQELTELADTNNQEVLKQVKALRLHLRALSRSASPHPSQESHPSISALETLETPQTPIPVIPAIIPVVNPSELSPPVNVAANLDPKTERTLNRRWL